jgi:hypothetical protein
VELVSSDSIPFEAHFVVEMDASIMDGQTGKAGAVSGVTIVKNPITAVCIPRRDYGN